MIRESNVGKKEYEHMRRKERSMGITKIGESAKPSMETSSCGLIMPLSALDGCSEQHWSDVRDILFDAIRDAGLDPQMVSDAEEVGIIQKRIIQNLYMNKVVVCDVSGKNPNVMFELGMRLAFDKPTIIVKDDKTTYSFDTAPIEHLVYPRDLRFNHIIRFKDNLKSKLIGTLEKAQMDEHYSTFLKNFGEFTVAKLETTEVPKDEFILNELVELRRLVSRIASRPLPLHKRHLSDKYDLHELNALDCMQTIIRALIKVQKSKDFGNKLFKLDSRDAVMAFCKNANLLPQCFDVSTLECLSQFEKAFDEMMTQCSSELIARKLPNNNKD